MRAWTWERWTAAAACVAALVPLFVFARQIRSGDYHPGSAYAPRVEAVLKASRTGMRGGPFAAVRDGEGYTLAPGLLNDLGMAAIADLWGRIVRRPLTATHLAVLNLAFMALALAALVAVVPARVRPALIVLFVAVPLCVREYRSPDSVTVHGALAALAIALAIAPHRRWPAWSGLAIGILLFLTHKVRSPFGLFAMGAIAVALLLVALRTRRVEVWRLLALAALAFVVLEVPWRIALDRRARDPRVVDEDILREHNVYNPLVSGIGWTTNRWGIEPWDPKVAEFLAARTSQAPVGLATFESERRARAVYLDLWREAPGYLAGFYLGRVPAAVHEYVWLGYWGAGLWLAAVALALRTTWRRRDAAGLALIVSPMVVAAGLLVQIVLIDPRLLYSYPLRFVSAFGLLTAAALVVAERRELPSGERGERREERGREEAELGRPDAARAVRHEAVVMRPA